MQQPQAAEEQTSHFVNPVSMAHNLKEVQRVRIITAALCGTTAGILGLTNIEGFAFFFFVSGLVSLSLFAILGFSVDNKFKSSTAVLTDGIAGNMLSYIFWWTFMYGIVHVY